MLSFHKMTENMKVLWEMPNLGYLGLLTEKGSQHHFMLFLFIQPPRPLFSKLTIADIISQHYHS